MPQTDISVWVVVMLALSLTGNMVQLTVSVVNRNAKAAEPGPLSNGVGKAIAQHELNCSRADGIEDSIAAMSQRFETGLASLESKLEKGLTDLRNEMNRGFSGVHTRVDNHLASTPHKV